jgi:hypothetical protein
MAMAATRSGSETPGILLHGVTHAELADVIGPQGAEFAGVRVWPLVAGSVAGLVSNVPRGSPWRLPFRFRNRPNTNLSPVLSALTSTFPLVPVERDTRFPAEEPLRQMLADRGDELDEIVLRHSAFLQCDVRADFDIFEAEIDVTAGTPVGALRASTDPEFTLVRRTLAQSVAGRQATFIARLRRALMDVAADMIVPEATENASSFCRRILLARSSRKSFRANLLALVREAGSGARLRISSFMPPLSFRRLEVRGADIAEVSAAKEALGLDESADRAAIRVAYRRTIERIAPAINGERRDRIDRLGAQFGLLDLVAEGQLRSACRPDADVRFDKESLAETWIIRLHVHNVADRVA